MPATLILALVLLGLLGVVAHTALLTWILRQYEEGRTPPPVIRWLDRRFHG